MSRQIDFLWNQEDKDNITVGVAGRGRRAVRRRVGRRRVGRRKAWGRKAWGKKSLLRVVRSRAVRSMLGSISAGRRREGMWM